MAGKLESVDALFGADFVDEISGQIGGDETDDDTTFIPETDALFGDADDEINLLEDDELLLDSLIKGDRSALAAVKRDDADELPDDDGIDYDDDDDTLPWDDDDTDDDGWGAGWGDDEEEDDEEEEPVRPARPKRPAPRDYKDLDEEDEEDSYDDVAASRAAIPRKSPRQIEEEYSEQPRPVRPRVPLPSSVEPEPEPEPVYIPPRHEGKSRTQKMREEAVQARNRVDDDTEDIEVPEWVVSMKSKLDSSVAHAFLLEGDIRDYMVRNITIRDGIVQVLNPDLESFDIVACYDQAQGLYFYGSEFSADGAEAPVELDEYATMEDVYRARFIEAMQESQAHLSLPLTADIPNRDIIGLFTLIADMFDCAGDYADSKILMFVDYADFLVPDASSAQMKPDERKLAIILSEMGRSEYADLAGNCLVFLTDDLTQLSSRIRSTESRIEKIHVPNPVLEERRDFIEHVLNVDDKVIKAPADRQDLLDAGLTPDAIFSADGEYADGKIVIKDGQAYKYVQLFEHPDSVSTEYLAINSAGLSRIQIEDIVLRSLSDDEPLNMTLVKDRKNEIIKQDYDDVLEIVDPDHGFDRIGGLDYLKRFFREEVIEPINAGAKEAVPMGVLLMGPPGTAKRVSNTTIIHTFNRGEKYAKDIVPGDKIFGLDGKPYDVLFVVPKGKDEVYEVILRDGRKVRCSGDHPFIVLEKSHGEWRERVMTPQEMIDKGVNVITPADRRRGQTTSNRARFFLPQPAAVQYAERELPLDPYVMGCFLGDGCKNLPGNFELSANTEDEETVARIAKTLGAVKYLKNKGACYSWHFYKEFYKSGSSKNRLMKINDVCPEYYRLLSDIYCHEKWIPREYLESSVSQRMELLRGLMDTDGSIKDPRKYKDKTPRYNLEFSTTSIQLRDDFVELVSSLGYNCSCGMLLRAGKQIQKYGEDTKYEHKHDLYTVYINVPNEVKSEFFKLGRKKEIAEAAAAAKSKTRNYSRIPIAEVRKTGEMEEMRCLAVDSPDHLFLVNDFIPTHNTFVSKAVAFEAGLNFVALNLNRIMEKWVGSTERNLDRALECAMQMAPTIIFIDEIDEALPNRSDPNASAVNKRINQRLLTFFSDVSHRGEVMILAATNYPEKLDPAFKRAGRFDIRLPMFAPDEFDRMRIIQIIAKSRKDNTGRGYSFSWFESPDLMIHNPFRRLKEWVHDGNAPVNQKFVGRMGTYKYAIKDEYGRSERHDVELPQILIDTMGKDRITLQQFYRLVGILFEDMEGRRTDPSSGEVETDEQYFERIDEYVADNIELIGTDEDDYKDICARMRKWERFYKPFQDKTRQMTGAELDVVMNECINLWKRWCRNNPDKLAQAIARGRIVDDHDIPFYPFLMEACQTTVSAISGIKEMEDNALLNTSNTRYIPDAMYAVTNDGREISYIERQDALVNKKMNVVD